MFERSSVVHVPLHTRIAIHVYLKLEKNYKTAKKYKFAFTSYINQL